VVGLAAHVGGYLLRSSVTTEPFALLADLLYALGWAMWTGVVVVLFVQVVPELDFRTWPVGGGDTRGGCSGPAGRGSNVPAGV
jgi:hypothetical protein